VLARAPLACATMRWGGVATSLEAIDMGSSGAEIGSET